MELIWTRATSLVRRAAGATILLALLVGITAGVAMAVVAAGRRTATVYDRFAAYADTPELLANLCPPGVVPDDDEGLKQCFMYDPEQEREKMLALPEVEDAARGMFRGATIAPAGESGDSTLVSTLAMLDEGIQSTAGRYRVVDGEDAATADEIVISEDLADEGFAVGDEVVLTFWTEDELGTFVEGATFHGPRASVRIAGIGRALTDVGASQVGFSANDNLLVYTGPGLAQATAHAAGFSGILIEATDDDAGAATAAIDAAFPDQPINLAPALGEEERAPSRDAIRYEAQGVLALGVAVGVVVAAFVAQVLARQSRREWDDGPALRAIGLTRGTAVASTLVRSLAISLPATVLALVAAIALSPLGPVGLGRAAEVDEGVDVDALVLGIGALAVIAIVTAAVVAPVVRGRVLRPTPRSTTRASTTRSISLPPVLSAGLHLARRGRSGSLLEGITALLGTAAAIAVGIAAVSLAASLDDLMETPARYGVPWDLSVGASAVGNDPAEVLADERVEPEIAAAAVITGNDMDIAGEVAWVYAYSPIEGFEETPPLPIASGRAPVNDREIAIGRVTLREIGHEVGDTVTVTSLARGETYEMAIVGEAIINDTFEASPGRGAVATPDFIDEAAPEVSGDPAVISLREGADVDAVAADLRASSDGPVQGPVPQAALRAVERIRRLPFIMTGVVAILAIASLIHALVLSVGRNRRAFGVLKGVGFTRAQVFGTVACQTTVFALLALVTAVPLGVFVGRAGWELVAEGLGVLAVPVVPAVPVIVVVLAALVVANVVGVYPAWRAARLRTAVALRPE